MSRIELPDKINDKVEVYYYGADFLDVELWYPRLEKNLKAIHVGLSDVRAADSIRIEYDFERDGYVIKQASKFEWDGADEKCDPDWKEVAFIEAWARQVQPTPPEGAS